MWPKPNISIIIPVHNAETTLEECLTAIFNSDYKNFELIMVNDGSTDKSLDIARQFPCSVITLDGQRRGAGAARNYGVREAKNSIILFVDSDVMVKQDSISRIAACLAQDNTLSGISGVYSIHQRYPNFLSQYKHLVACYRERMSEDINQDSFKSAFLALRREVLEGYKFDESFNRASIEDIEFGRVLISSGYRFILDKSVEVEHLKKFSVNAFFKNQYYRARDIIKIYLHQGSYKFYYSQKRKNRYAKIYVLRVPIAYASLSLLSIYLISQNYIFLLSIGILLLISIYLERGFLRFCLPYKGFGFLARSIMIYFIDGLISGLGILKGITEKRPGR